MTAETTVALNIEGMHCTGCAQGIEAHLKRSGINGVNVDYATGTAYLTLQNGNDPQTIIEKIEKLGYRARVETHEDHGAHKSFSLKLKFLIALIFTLPLLLHMFIDAPWLHDAWVQLGLSLPVVLIALQHFGVSAYRSVRSGSPNMDVLIIIGVVASFGYSLAGLILGLGDSYLFFETAAAITTFILLGNLIEEYSVKKTASAISELTKLQPSQAKRLESKNGAEATTVIPVSEIRIGDRLLVGSGDKIPVDGEIFWGDATVDESIISGESVPVERGSGDTVVGGGLVIQGSLKITATAVGSNTVLAQIVKMVREAQTRKPSIQRIGDRVSAVFIPVVLVIALLTFLGSALLADISVGAALLRAVAVLVIACPCAMGLAVPTALLVGLGRAARNGILVRGGDTIERLNQIKCVVFDKTGTLTTGNFKLKHLQVLTGDPAQIKAILVDLERHSSHPIAQSLVAELGSHPTREWEKIEERKGLGVLGIDRTGNKFEVGSAKILSANIQDGAHDIYLLENGRLIAWLDISDEIKPGAKEALNALRKYGHKLVMLSGDNHRKCKAVAEELGITEFHAEKRPEEKLKIVAELEQNQPTAFVGDGINDAPALAQAYVGISLGSGTQVAIQSAQVVLLGSNLKLLPQVFDLARVTLQTIKENLFWAFSYNIVAIPIAALGYLSPLVAALTMAFSDVMTIGNSLRLRYRVLRCK